MTVMNSTETVVKASASVFSYLFYKRKFEVPWHQRYYDWGKEDVADLLSDLDEAFREKRECYFLGTIMLVEKSSCVWEINDGQQRMVTFSLICAKLARVFSNGVDTRREGLALRILFDLSENHTKYLWEADDLTPRISPPRNDQANYNFLIRGKDIGTNGKLTAAWNKVNDYFAFMDRDKSQKFFDFVINKLEVACLFIPSKLDPNSVFETLNARGKPLGALDLIRNHLYSFFSREEEARRNTVHRNLEDVRRQLAKSKAEDYIRCYLQCKYGFLPKDRLYREMKAKFKDKHSGLPVTKLADYVFSLVEDFSCKDRIEVYRSISSPSENDPLIGHFLKNSGKTTSKRNLFVFLRELRNYRVAQPIIFALLNRYVQETDSGKKKKFARFVHGRLKLLNSFIMRTSFVARKFEPSQFEKEFANLAQKIMSAKLPGSISFADVLKSSDSRDVFNDSRFVENMQQTTIRDKEKARRFLLGLAYYQSPNDLIINENRYTVEHILPKSDKYLSDWTNFDEIQHAENVHRVGNLALLAQTDNKSGDDANRDFSVKKTIYERSIIPLTKEIAKIVDWSPVEIHKRQEKLAQLASKVWDIPNVQ